MKFNEKLVKLRKENLLSQEELAEKLGVARQTISKWELRQTTPDMDKLSQMAKLFNISVDELLNESEEPIKTEADPIKNNESSKEKKNLRPVIIISILVVLLLVIIGSLGFMAINKIGNAAMSSNEKNQGIFEKIFGTVSNIIDTELQEMQEEDEKNKEIKEEFKNASERIENAYNTMESDYKTYENKIVDTYNKDTINSKYEDLYTGLQSKFFTETAIKYVIQDNINNEKKITVKYNDITAIESEELTNLKSSLNKKEYLITYDYDADGYICQMNIKDV